MESPFKEPLLLGGGRSESGFLLFPLWPEKDRTWFILDDCLFLTQYLQSLEVDAEKKKERRDENISCIGLRVYKKKPDTKRAFPYSALTSVFLNAKFVAQTKERREHA